ncbi:hypothetical protein [Conexibacter woesei]|uniref:hypothetical protein n=1 Tax=Conexibacter woesei TaxID=191495 RepID=UPI0012DE8D40|nr:hypothetical protein [Conexibacter woesei]
MVAAVVECWRDLGGPPTVAVYDAWSAGRSDVPSSASARKFIDGWQDARLSAWEIIHNISLPRTDLPGVERVEPDPESGEPILAVQGQAGEGLSNDDRNPPVEEVGVPYRPADEEADPNPAALAAPDPELVRAAWRSHARLQNELADLARAAGLVPLSPHRDPRFDIAWRSQAGTLVICEVKSADIDTGEAQIRAAFAQVLRYQLGAERRFGEAVEARIYIEREPDELWLALCDRFGLKVAFPPHARTLIDE